MADLWLADTATATVALESALQFWNSVPFRWMFVGHALYCTAAGSEFKDRWLLHLLVSAGSIRSLLCD
jgi:hypothetical protein